MSKQYTKSGFTILELMIATLVFSVMLLLCMVGVSRMGRLYYKGITQARTQELTRQISDEFISQIQFGKGNVTPSQIPSASVNGGVPVIFCIGDIRYRLVLNRQLDSAAGPLKATQVFLKEPLSGSGCVLTDTFGSNAVELVSKGVRISRFRISSVGSGLWTLDMRVTFGDEDVIRYTNTVALADTPAQYETAYCASVIAGSELCATSSLKTTIQRRIVTYTGWRGQL